MARRAHPPLRITDPRFTYVPAIKTDVRETFARARAQMAVAGITVVEVPVPLHWRVGLVRDAANAAAGAPR